MAVPSRISWATACALLLLLACFRHSAFAAPSTQPSIEPCARETPIWPLACGCRYSVLDALGVAWPAGPELAAPITALVAAQPQPSRVGRTDKPNIVLLMGDDHGWPYFGFMGSKDVLTPNLDKLAREGTLFTRGHSTASVCLPTLNTMLTGLHPYQIETMGGLHDVAHKPNPMGEVNVTHKLLTNDSQTLPRLLAANGYISFQGGKLWSVTYAEAGFTEGMTRHADPNKKRDIYVLAGDEGLALGRKTNQPVYDFIDKHADKPFFIWYSPMLPHTPIDPPQKFLDLYKDRDDLSPSAKKYYANCTRYDAAAGQLLDYLRGKGLMDNTLVIYFNDNGWDQPPTVDFTGNAMASAIGGDRGKLSMHELGFRTPFIFHAPGRVPAGVRKDGFVSQMDLYLTLLDFAGVTSTHPIDGKSLRPTIEQKEDFSRDHLIGSMRQVRTAPDRPAITMNPWANPEQAFYITSAQWHYIRYETRGTDELYDKITDPEETKNVAAENPQVVKQLREQVEQWRARMAKDLPKVAGVN